MHYDEHSLPKYKDWPTVLKNGDTYSSTNVFGSHSTYVEGRWLNTANLTDRQKQILATPAAALAATDEKLPPMACSEGCGFTNEYVGKEHLINGIYVCRQCRPRYERRQRTVALQKENAEAAEKREYTSGGSPFNMRSGYMSIRF